MPSLKNRAVTGEEGEAALEEPTPTRAEIRAILANPRSTPRQILEAKLVLLKRMTRLEDTIRQVCERYRLTPEQTADMLARRHTASVALEAFAADKLQQVEQALKDLERIE